MTTARNLGIDRLRRESTRTHRHQQAFKLTQGDRIEDLPAARDAQLPMMFTCAHPALAPTAQVALPLRLLGGPRTPEIARSCLVPEKTMAQRLVRAKAKIKAAGIPYRSPPRPSAHTACSPVGSCLPHLHRRPHRRERVTIGAPGSGRGGIHLARLIGDLMPDEPEVTGLLALTLLSESHREARTAPDGSLVLLVDQDRTEWDRTLISEGHELVRAGWGRNRPGPFQVQAAIQAVHTDARTSSDTDWHQIVELYVSCTH